MNATNIRRGFRFSSGALYRDAQRLLGALQDPHLGPAVVAHLPATFVADFTNQIAVVSQHDTDQSGATGMVGALTRTQANALAAYADLARVARRSARLAFPAQVAQLHSEFNVGARTPKDLSTILGRARALLAACQKYPDALAAHGWSAAATTALTAAIDALAGADSDKAVAADVKVGLTSDRNSVTTVLYRQCLAAQNAARIAYPKTQVTTVPGIVEARARFLLDEFPPRESVTANPSAAAPAAPAVAPVAPVAVAA